MAPVFVDKLRKQPLLCIRNHFPNKADWSLAGVAILLILFVGGGILEALLGGETMDISDAGIVVIMACFLAYAIWKRANTVAAFCDDAVVCGFRPWKWTFLFAKHVPYYGIEEIRLTRAVLMRTLVIRSPVNGVTVHISTGWRLSSLMPVLMFLSEKAEAWAFDQRCRELIEDQKYFNEQK